MAFYPAKFTVHKGKMGALQAGPIPPTVEEQENQKTGKIDAKVTKEGCILIEMANFKAEVNGNATYDWDKEKKVSFALGLPDIAQIMEKAGSKFSLVHKNEKSGETKTMFFEPGEGQYEGTMRVSLMAKKGDGAGPSARIAFSNGEFQVFATLLKAYLPIMLGWTA